MYLSLFAVCFISATLWPMASEALFIALLYQNNDALLPLLMTASLANSLGSIAMFELALRSSNWLNRNQSHLTQQAKWQSRLVWFGSPLLALSWLPVVGDLLPIAAGLLKMQRLKVYVWLWVGKTARYAVLSVITLGLFSDKV